MEEGGRIFEKKKGVFFSVLASTPSLRFGAGGTPGVWEGMGQRGSYIYILREGGREGGNWGREMKKGKRRGELVGWLGLGIISPFYWGGGEGVGRGRIWRRCITYDGGFRNLSSYKTWLL